MISVFHLFPFVPIVPLASYIDYTLLSPTATDTGIQDLCETAVVESFAAVCVPPVYVQKAREWVAESTVKVCSVVGFPLGYNDWEVKMWESRRMVDEGVQELDMVVNITAVKNKNWQYVEAEIARFLDICKENQVLTKIILEVTRMEKEEIVRLCEVLNELRPSFAKTSTGFSGISIWDEKDKVALMHETLIPEIPIKVAGGVRTTEQALFFIENYRVKRIGTSALLKI